MAGDPLPPVDVQHVAALASLTLTHDEAARLAGELATLVAYVSQLEELDTQGVPPTAHVELARLPFREDVVTPGLSHADALAQAPAVDGESFVVPAFVE